MTKTKCVRDKQGRIIPIDKIIEIDSKSKTIVTDKSDYSTVYELYDEDYNALLNELEIIKCIPRFVAGDYIITQNNIIGKIVSVDITNHKYYYKVINGYFGKEVPFYATLPCSFDEAVGCRRWSLNCIVDGDILSYKDEVFIYKRVDNTDGALCYYACYDGDTLHIDSFYSLSFRELEDIKPANTEQRKLLFTHLDAAGYIFDEITKVLIPKVCLIYTNVTLKVSV